MRVTHFLKAAAALTVLCLSANSALAAKLSPVGVWYDHTGRGAVEIKPCGNRLCGHIVWTRSKKDSKKGCGKKLIGNLKKISSKTWDRGWIFSPERGQKYDLEVKPVSRNKLRMLGYAGSKIFSKTMYWKRAPKDLVRCDRPAPKVDTPIIAKKKIDKTKTAKKPAKVKPVKKVAKAAPAIVAPKPSPVKRAAPVVKKAPAKIASRKNDDSVSTARGVEPANASNDPGGKKISAQDQIDAYQKGDDEPDSAATETKPAKKKKKRTAGLKKKKRCKIAAPFVTVSFPCPE